MYIQVKLLNGFQEPLLYSIPIEWNDLVQHGSLVTVPLKAKFYPAYVTKIFHDKPTADFALRQAFRLEHFPSDHNYYTFINQIASYYQTDQTSLIRRIRFFLHDSKIIPPENHLVEQEISSVKTASLTSEQEAVYSFVSSCLHNPSYCPTLLHGVTGSGKTEVYKKLILTNFALDKTTLLLLPEVSLALQFYYLLKHQLPNNILLFSFHSATCASEKKKLWQALLKGLPVVIIGVHLPILLPIKNLGFIIIDEEHESGYQEKKHPKINSKEAALLRAQLLDIPILLGSATPSLQSLYNVEYKKWNFFQLKQRFQGTFPTVQIVSLSNKKKRANFWISNELYRAIAQQLEKKEQTLLFLNRRGYSFFLQCKQCNHVIYCPSCSVSLTLHESAHLLCHYCGHNQVIPPFCTSCNGPDFLKKGVGTQQIMQIIQKLFPQARVARADLDSTINKKTWHATLEQFHNGTLDILIGTQTITKGYNFKKVSLVGILWADLNLHLPVYNALEVTLQQLIQVAGRAGRFGLSSNVIVQTMGDYELFSYLHEIDYLKFYRSELENRKSASYPPFIRFAEIELRHNDDAILDEQAHLLADFLNNNSIYSTTPITILGPSLPLLYKIKNCHIRKIYLKSSSINALLQLYQSIDQTRYLCTIFFTPNPLN